MLIIRNQFIVDEKFHLEKHFKHNNPQDTQIQLIIGRMMYRIHIISIQLLKKKHAKRQFKLSSESFIRVEGWQSFL